MYGLVIFVLTTLAIANTPKPLFERQDIYSVNPGDTVTCQPEFACGGGGGSTVYCLRQNEYCCDSSEYQSIFFVPTLSKRSCICVSVVIIANYVRSGLSLSNWRLLPRFQRMLS